MDTTKLTKFNEVAKLESNFIKLEEGKTVLRIVSPIHGVLQHNITVGQDKKFPVCPKAMEEWAALEEDRQPDYDAFPCPLCESTNMPLRRIDKQFLCLALDRKAQKVGILKKGKTIFDPIFENRNNGLELFERDMVISRTGKGLQDTKYVVTFMPKDDPLNPEEVAMVEDTAKVLDIAQFTVPRSYEDIKNIMLGKKVDNKV